jgi:hypothetical protein
VNLLVHRVLADFGQGKTRHAHRQILAYRAREGSQR